MSQSEILLDQGSELPPPLLADHVRHMPDHGHSCEVIGTSFGVKGCRTPAGQVVCGALGRQASDKPQGRKLRGDRLGVAACSLAFSAHARPSQKTAAFLHQADGRAPTSAF